MITVYTDGRGRFHVGGLVMSAGELEFWAFDQNNPAPSARARRLARKLLVASRGLQLDHYTLLPTAEGHKTAKRLKGPFFDIINADLTISERRYLEAACDRLLRRS